VPYLIFTNRSLLRVCSLRPGAADGAAGCGGGGRGEQRNLGWGVEGCADAEEDAALAEVRGMVGAVPNWRRESSGQGGAARGATARRPRAGWLAVWPVVVGGGAGRRSPEVGKKGDIS
jgi:hypothetical protein